MILDLGEKPFQQEDIMINGETVERVTTYQYLGTIVDHELNWRDNAADCVEQSGNLQNVRQSVDSQIENLPSHLG